jgi:hypothetical protein
LRKRNSVIIFVLLIVLGIGALSGLIWANSTYLASSTYQADFNLGWTASNEWLYSGISPYDLQVSQQAQNMYSTIPTKVKLESTTFYTPMYSILFFSPFGLLDFPTGKILWLTTLEISFFITILLSLKISGWRTSLVGIVIVLVLSIIWYNSTRSIMLGQFTILPLLLMVAAILLILNKQDVGAGFLLALSTSKPDISFLLVVYVFLWSIFTGRKKLTTSLFVSICFLFLISTLLLPGWLLDWFRIMLESANPLHLYHTALSTIARTLPGIKNPLNIILHSMVILLMVIAWIRSMKRDDRLFVWTVGLTLTVTSLIGFRLDLSYSLLLLPALFLIFHGLQERWKQNGEILNWVGFILFVGFSWLMYFILVRTTNIEPTILYILPPVTVLMGLYWIHWWTIRATQLPFEVFRDRYRL